MANEAKYPAFGGLMRPLDLVFPRKPHPEDINPVFALCAKAVFAFGLICFVWSAFFLVQWGRSYGFVETAGVVEYGALRFVKNHVTNVSFDYEVAGKVYTSQNIAIGGRPLGAMPPPGRVVAYYNPDDPEEAVLIRRPVEVVVLGFCFSLVSPFLARLVWRTYA